MLLTGCAARFSVTQTGYTDTKTGVHYVALSSAFEAAAGGEEVGTFEDETHGRTVRFRVIPGADATRFLTDEDGAVYCADEKEPDPATWKIKRILVCQEDMISVEIARVTVAEEIQKIREIWFEGEECELPLDAAKGVRYLKVVSDDFPGVYYGFRFYVYEDGSYYFYSPSERRAVSVPEELAKTIYVE